MSSKQTELEAKNLAATILLWAGTFTELQGERPLLKPFNLARNLLQTCGFQQPGFIVPIPAQEQPVRQRWRAVIDAKAQRCKELRKSLKNCNGQRLVEKTSKREYDN
jgi:hypothetical protein